MKISSLEAFKQTGKHLVSQHVLHTISGGTETSSAHSNEEPTDPIPATTAPTDAPLPPPRTTIYRIDGDFVYS